MSGECTTTPGTSWSSDPITDAKLNQTANPVVRVNENAIGERELDIPAVASLIVGGTVLPNYVRNPTFTQQQFPNGYSVGSRMMTAAAGWYWTGTGTAGRTTSIITPTGSPTRLRVSGAAGTDTGMAVGQSFGSIQGNHLYNKQITVAFEFTNQSGGAIVPSLRLRTYASPDNASGALLAYDQSAPIGVNSIANNQSGQIFWTVNLQSLGIDVRNGFDLEIYIASTLTDPSRYIEFYNASLVIAGAAVPFPATAPLAVSRQFYSAALPTANDDRLRGWMIGDEWVVSLSGFGTSSIWRCIDNTPSVAVWRETTGIRRLVNQWFAASTTSASTTTVIPADNTIPQNTEGAQVFSLSVVPSSTSNRLEFTISGLVDLNATGYVSVAVFQDSIANAIYASAVVIDSTTRARHLMISFEIAVPSTVAQTYTVRIGPSTGTAFWLRVVGGDVFGGVCRGLLAIRELAPTS